MYHGCALPYSGMYSSDRTEVIEIKPESFSMGIGRNISCGSENEFEMAQVIVGAELHELLGDILGGKDVGIIDRHK